MTISEDEAATARAAAAGDPRGKGITSRVGKSVGAIRRPSQQPAAVPDGVLAALAMIQDFQRDLAHEFEKMSETAALHSGTIAIRGTGHWTWSWQVQYRAVAVANYSPGLITVTTGPPVDGPPGPGPGTHRVPPGAAGVFAMMGNALTVYGRSGDLVDLQVFTRSMPPAYGTVGTSGFSPVGAYTYDGAGHVLTETHSGMTVAYAYDGSFDVTSVT